MVGFGLHAFFLKECGGLFDFSARGPVDDARLPLMAAEKRKQLGMRFLFGQDMIEQVRTVERSPDQPGLPQAEPGKDRSTSGVAVAVNAATGHWGNRSTSPESAR